MAIFGDATYQFSRSFDIQFGARVSRNEQRSQLTQGGLLAGGVTIVNDPRESSETTTTWQVAPRWHFNEDAMAYARIATGYRAGGPALPIPGAPPELPTSFDSDSTINYELGYKAAFLDNSLSLDVAAFYIDWTDIQIITTYFINGVNWATTGNAGTAVSKGLEWNLSWTPIEGLQIGLIGAYTDAQLTKDAPALGAQDGDELPYVPDLTNTLSADYSWTIGRYSAFVGAGWSYVGERRNDFPEHVKLPDYNTYEARAGISAGRYSMQLFGKNLSDEQGMTGYGSLGAFGGTGYAALIRPRVIGVRFTADF
jgi:outer membrane receptor protein involved in Fe transport